MRIFVTGGAGFIGSHLVRKLRALNHSVVVIDEFNDFYSPDIKRANVAEFDPEVEVIEGDIRKASDVDKAFHSGSFDAIVHIAARAGVRPSIRQPQLYVDTNVSGTLNLLEAARKHEVRRFVFASSSSVYGLAKTVPFSEDLPLPQTLSPYAATKLAGEQLCGNYSNLYGLRSVCLRFFTVYGPGQRPDLAIHKFTDAIYHSHPIPKFGEGQTRRDYTYIDDIIQGVLGALDYEGALFDIFNLGESETTTLNELIELLESTLGRRAIIEQLPEQKGDMPLTCADISKAKQFLGYHPKVKMAEGIPKFVEWYLARQKADVR